MNPQEADRLLTDAFQSHGLRLLGLCFLRTDGDLAKAQDVVSFAFIRTWEAMLRPSFRYQDQPRLEGFITRTALNRIINLNRPKHTFDNTSLDSLVSENPHNRGFLFDARQINPEAQVENRQLMDYLNQALTDLTPVQRQVLELKLNTAMSNAEIGRLLGVSEGAIKSLFFRATDKLRRLLHHQGLP